MRIFSRADFVWDVRMDARERAGPSRAATPLAGAIAAWLVAAFGDEEGRRILDDARKLAGDATLETPDDVVDFGKGPVARALARLFEARVAALLLRSLEAELGAAFAEHEDDSSPPRSRPLGDGSLPASSPRRASTQRLRRKRPVVGLLVHDGLGRSGLARTLLQGECDARPLDDEDDLPVDTDVVIVDVASATAERALRAVVARHPTLPVLIWTSLPLADATAIAQRLGANRRLAVSRDVHGRDLLDLVHVLAATLPPTRRGDRS